MTKKLFTLLLAVAASVGTMFAQSGTCGDNVTWDLTDGVLTINGTGDMYNYGKRETPWDDYRFSILSVIITDGVTTIGNHAFYYCTNLTSIEIPNSVTSVGWRAFNSCSSLISVTIPNNVTSISSEAFAFCSSLSSVSIGKSVTVIGSNAFLDCKKLTSVNINDIAAWCTIRFERGVDQAENMQYANPLYYAGNLYLDNTLVEDLVIPNGVTEIAFQAFADCKSITSVTIPEGVTCLGKGAFLGCSNLSSIKLPTSLTNLGTYTFSGCTGLTSIEIPDGVTSIGEYTFNKCTNLTSVVIPNSITHIGYEAFAYCRNLTSFTNHAATPQSMDMPFTMVTLANATLYVPAESIALYNAYPNWAKFGTIKAIGDDSTSCVVASGTCGAEGDNLTWTLTCDSVLTISGTGDMGDNASWLSDYKEQVNAVIIADGVTSIGRYAFQNCSSLTSVNIPNSVTSIGDDAFYGCSGLTSVTIPNSVTSIGYNAFAECTGLTSVTIPNSVAGIEQYAFYGCTSLTSIEIPNSVTSIGRGVFRGCTSLTSIEIPNSITSIGNEVLYGCTSLISIEIPNSITSIGNEVLYGCTSLTSVTIPNSVTSIGDWAFYGCSSLTSIEIPQSVRSIGEHAFSGCSGLTAIEIPDQVTNIKYGAFAGCRGLTTIEIPSNVTSIGMSAFDDCRGLTSVTIPNSVTRIDNNAFLYCYSLTSVTVPNSVTVVNNGAFAGVTNVVYSGSVNGAPWGAKSKNGYVEGCLVYNDASKTILRGCSAIATGEIVIPNSVTTINERAFEGCEGITSVTIPNSVTSIGYYAFPNIANISYTGSAEGSPWGAKCVNGYVDGYFVYSDASKTSLLACSTAATGEIVIPNSVTTIGEQAFMYCGGITSVSFPNSVTSIGNMAFFGCSALTSIDIPISVTSIGEYAFGSCMSLTSITIPYSVYENSDRDSQIFGEGTHVTEIHFVGSIEEWLKTTYNFSLKMFPGYRLYVDDVIIDNLTIPNSVTSIGYEAFAYCSSLTSVTIPYSVTSIGVAAFNGCSSLTSITCEAITPPTLGNSVFSYDVDISIPLYVPAQSVDLYKAADQWKKFTNILPIPGVEPEKFSITWQDEDGNPIKVDEVAYGEIPVFSGATPTKEATAEYTYEFAGWLPKVKEVTEDVKYTTFFERNKIEPTVFYTVNINGENCSLHISNELPAGTKLQVEAVADECFQFEKWSDNNTDNPRTITVTEDSNLTAEFNKVTYTIIGENENEGGEVQIIP